MKPPIKEIEQTELYKQIRDKGIVIWKLRELPVLMFILMNKINEIARRMNEYETNSQSEK